MALPRLSENHLTVAALELAEIGETPHLLAIKSALIGRVTSVDLHFTGLKRAVVAAVDHGALKAVAEGRVLAFRAPEIARLA